MVPSFIKIEENFDVANQGVKEVGARHKSWISVAFLLYNYLLYNIYFIGIIFFSSNNSSRGWLMAQDV